MISLKKFKDFELKYEENLKLLRNCYKKYLEYKKILMEEFENE